MDITNNKNFWFALFCVGVAFAIATAAKMPADGSDWPTTLPTFLAAAMFAGIALIFWRGAVKEDATKKGKAKTLSHEDPKKLLANAEKELTSIKSELKKLKKEQLCSKIDHVLEHSILAFAEVRQSVLDSYGLEKGAEILVTVAYAERMVNRVWSAAADDCLEEAHTVFPDALSAIKEANAMM